MMLATCPWRMTGSEPRTAEDCDIKHCIIDTPHAVMESHTHAICYGNENNRLKDFPQEKSPMIVLQLDSLHYY